MPIENPYAVPTTPVEAVCAATLRPPDANRLAHARTRLAAHLADPAARAVDKAFAGPRFGMASMVFAALLVATLAVGVAASPLWFIGSAVALVLVLVFAIRDYMLGPREVDTTPVAAFRNHLRAAQWGRDGYVLSTICPTGREEPPTVPDLALVPVGTGGSMASKAGIKAYFRNFLRPGTGQYRWAKVHKPQLVAEEGDVAQVQSKVVVSAIPQLAYTISVVLFVFVRIVGLIALAIVWSVFRKSTTVTVTKTFLRGDDGLWYALQGGWEGEVERA